MLVFIAGRIVLGVTGWEALGVEIAQAVIWSCLALSVVLADVAIHWKEIRSALPVPVRSGVSRKDSMPKNAVVQFAHDSKEIDPFRRLSIPLHARCLLLFLRRLTIAPTAHVY